MQSRTRSIVTTAAAAAVLSLGNLAPAADITWSPVTRITGPSSLNQTGTFISAINMGGGQGSLPIVGTDITFIDGAITAPVGGGAISNSYNSTYYDPTTGDINLDTVLDSHSYVENNNPNSRGRVDLTGLTPGTPYIIQVIGVADVRGCCSARIQTLDDGAGHISGDLQRGLANSVLGTFIADAATQSFFVSGVNDPGLSGLVLRAVPEPGAFTVLALAAAGTLLRRRRRGA
jgi:hypothetical protein